MKEKRFNFRNSYYKAIKSMDDKQAGKFIKGLCGYVFDGKTPDTNDTALQSTFELVKVVLDNEQRNRENARLGGLATAKVRREQAGMSVLSDATILAEGVASLEDLIALLGKNATQNPADSSAK